MNIYFNQRYKFQLNIFSCYYLYEIKAFEISRLNSDIRDDIDYDEEDDDLYLYLWFIYS